MVVHLKILSVQPTRKLFKKFSFTLFQRKGESLCNLTVEAVQLGHCQSTLCWLAKD